MELQSHVTFHSSNIRSTRQIKNYFNVWRDIDPVPFFLLIQGKRPTTQQFTVAKYGTIQPSYCNIAICVIMYVVLCGSFN